MTRALRETRVEILPGSNIPAYGDPSPPPVVRCGGWLSRMYTSRKISFEEMHAGADILRALATIAEGALARASAGVSAVDTTRVVVDGGRSQVGRLPRGIPWDGGAVERWGAFREGFGATLVNGRLGDMRVCDMVEGVLTGNWGSDALDTTLGIRRGRTNETVIKALGVYGKGT